MRPAQRRNHERVGTTRSPPLSAYSKQVCECIYSAENGYTWRQHHSHQKIGDLTGLSVPAGAQLCSFRDSSQPPLNLFQDMENLPYLASSLSMQDHLPLLVKNSFHPKQQNSKSSLQPKQNKTKHPTTGTGQNYESIFLTKINKSRALVSVLLLDACTCCVCSFLTLPSYRSPKGLCLHRVSSSVSPMAEGTHGDLARVTEQDQMIGEDP